jgi:hypothetical protein
LEQQRPILVEIATPEAAFIKGDRTLRFIADDPVIGKCGDHLRTGNRFRSLVDKFSEKSRRRYVEHDLKRPR